ncbi:MAG: radical SAM protein [Nitrospirae bacterium]|nr:MAG: radical SAM protein [Nitrospirota bacterium]
MKSYRQLQIEITTCCNFNCFYCAGRDMEQRHMDYGLLLSLIRKTEKGGGVHLQGEGEPMLYPRLGSAVDEIIAQGCRPFLITNGSCLDIDLVLNKFPELGISLDTLDPELASENGRYDLPRVLSNLEGLLQAGYPPSNIVIFTTAFGQPTADLTPYLASRGIHKHVVQPLQQKEDYRYRYPEKAMPPQEQYPVLSCHFISREGRRFYNVDGVEMPCCYIKNAARFVSIDHIKRSFAESIVPESCRGCRYLSRKRR